MNNKIDNNNKKGTTNRNLAKRVFVGVFFTRKKHALFEDKKMKNIGER
jgi:hypothetical protein